MTGCAPRPRKRTRPTHGAANVIGMPSAKIQLYFWTAVSITLMVFALLFYASSHAGITHPPDESTLSETQGTLQKVQILRDRFGPYYARLHVLGTDGKTHRFSAPDISGVADRFSALQPGSQLNITYRTGPTGLPRSGPTGSRIMELWVNGSRVWSLADSAALSAFIKSERAHLALYCLVAAICSLVMAVVIYRKYR